MFRMKLETNNAAFTSEDPTWEREARGAELARILRHVADLAEQGFTSEPQVLDSNGNNVGSWELD